MPILIVLLLLILASSATSLNFTVLNDSPPWTQSYRARWSSNPTALLLYNGWPLPSGQINDSLEPADRFNFNNARQTYLLEGAWRSANQGLNWGPVEYTILYRLMIKCTARTQPVHQKVVKVLTSMDLPNWPLVSPNELQWLAWQALTIFPLNKEERLTCLTGGHFYYSLVPESNIKSTVLEAMAWQIQASVPRFGALTAIHYQNSHLQANIYYVMGGGIPQPDGLDHQLQDLWASKDQGQSWILIRDRNFNFWGLGSQPEGFAISRQGVMVVSVCNRILYQDQIWVSMDGGRQWGLCPGEENNLGLRSHGTLGFDSDGYLYIVGGHRTIAPEDNILRSQMSFENISAVSRQCENLDFDPGGLGLKEWKSDSGFDVEAWKIEPQLGSRWKEDPEL